MADSANRSRPDAPMGFEHSTPPEGLTGISPPISVSPASVSWQPRPGGAKPRFSSHIGSNQENGTYISATSISSIGREMPAFAHSAAAPSAPARGLTWSLPENIVGSVRIDVALIQATGPDEASAAAGSPITTAHAPSDDGHVSSYRTGSHSIGEAWTFASVMSGCRRCAYGFRAPLRRSFTATMAPTCGGEPLRRM